MPSTDLNPRKNQGHPEVKHIEPFDRNSENNFMRNSRRVNFCYIGNSIQQENTREIIH